MNSTRRANRLARDTSPYLLQHAFNPVDWYPWGDEANDRSRDLPARHERQTAAQRRVRSQVGRGCGSR